MFLYLLARVIISGTIIEFLCFSLLINCAEASVLLATFFLNRLIIDGTTNHFGAKNILKFDSR